VVKNQKGFTLTELLVVVVWILIVFVSAWGWVWNIIKLADMDSGVTGLFVLRIIGIFLAPLGVVVGFI
jgi:prepilin-type N-terminal cleavage/methylation domain-containing protein